MWAIQLNRLTRLFRNGRGIREVDLQVAGGEVFGFLGPNGAGKTTLIRTLLGFLRPDSGSGQVLGLDIVRQSREIRRRVGYLPSDPALYEFLTGAQHIEFALAVRGVKDRGRVRILADRLDVDLSRRVKSLSRGNRQKVAIIAALAHDPELLILDEPTSGLDPLMQEAFVSLIREERARGKTVFISSHVLSEVEALCERVGVIRDGRIIAADAVDHLKKRRVKYVTCEFVGPAPDLSGLPGVQGWQAEGSRARFTLAGALDPVVAALSRYSLADLTVADPPLEEVFRSFYGGGEGL
jgi:ABC-2 type transport system ATP-binding protein